MPEAGGTNIETPQAAEELPYDDEAGDRGEARPAEGRIVPGRRVHCSFLRIFHSPSTSRANSPLAAHVDRLARPRQRHIEHLVYAAGTRAEHHHAIGEVDRLLHAVGDEHDGLALLRPQR